MTSSVGLKIVMAVTGVMLSAFILIHMLGNLQIFQGAEAIDGYSKLLHKEPAILWAARAGLLGAVGLHIWAYLVLTRKNQRARGVNYRETKHRESSYASRSMRLTGPLLLAFIIFHILHLTTGTVHPDYHEGSVYRNLIAGLKVPGRRDRVCAVDGDARPPPLARGLEHVPDAGGPTRRGTARPAVGSRPCFTVVVVLGFAVVPLGIVARLIK